MTGRIVSVKHFAVHDGDGIRTTLFLKGCPLKCVWCHNPESICFQPVMAYYETKCMGCGRCEAVCPEKAHTVAQGVHRFLREKCTACGRCVPECMGEALERYGRSVTTEEILPELLEDRAFYETSGGGVTLSGGECLAQAEFCAELLKKLKEQGVHTAVDTCGQVSRSAFDLVMPYTDVFLYDIKAMDEEVHRRCTGHTNRQILENLRYLDDSGASLEIRYPYVPGYNDGEWQAIAQELLTLKHLTKVRILPYHHFAGSRYEALGMENTLPKVPLPGEEIVCQLREHFSKLGLPVYE